jgi:hypothetical protein
MSFTDLPSESGTFRIEIVVPFASNRKRYFRIRNFVLLNQTVRKHNKAFGTKEVENSVLDSVNSDSQLVYLVPQIVCMRARQIMPSVFEKFELSIVLISSPLVKPIVPFQKRC